MTRIDLGGGARLDWLPQETILFEGSHLSRVTEVDLAPDALVSRGGCGDPRATRPWGGRADGPAGRHPHDPAGRGAAAQEHLALGPDALGDRAALGDARAFATLVLAAADAGDALAPMRALPSIDGVRRAVSAWDGRLVMRFMARDPAPLRRALICAIVALRGFPMPRVWQSET